MIISVSLKRMKKVIPTLLISFIILTGINCTEKAENGPTDRVPVNLGEVLTKANSACGFASPEESLDWLINIIIKGEEDIETGKHKGNYVGKIILANHQNKPVFYVQMMMGSGGLPARLFDCSGTAVTVGVEGYPQQGALIYSNLPPD
jgi:hypothetical protein